jgi:hypothetical protein
MAVASAQLESYLERFSEFARETARDVPAWLRELREAAFARFRALDFQPLTMRTGGSLMLRHLREFLSGCRKGTRFRSRFPTWRNGELKAPSRAWFL